MAKSSCVCNDVDIDFCNFRNFGYSTLRLSHIYQFIVTLNISEGETLALQVLTILGLVLSILGLLATVIGLAVFRLVLATVIGLAVFRLVLATVIGLAVFRLVHDVIYYMCTDTVLFVSLLYNSSCKEVKQIRQYICISNHVTQRRSNNVLSSS